MYARIIADVRYYFTVQVPNTWGNDQIIDAVQMLEFENDQNFSGRDIRIAEIILNEIAVPIIYRPIINILTGEVKK